MKHRYIENLSKRDARIKVHNMGWTNPRRRSITNTSSSEFDSGSEKNKSPTRNNNNNLPLRRRDPLDDVEDDESNHSSDDMETSSMNDLGLLFQRDPIVDNKNEAGQPDQQSANFDPTINPPKDNNNKTDSTI